MWNIIKTIGLGIVAFFSIHSATSPVLGAATVFNSNQVGTSAAAGSVLQTNGATSTWVTTSSLGISGGGGSGTVGPSTSTYVSYFNTSSTITGSSTFTFSSSTGNLTVPSVNGILYASQFPGADVGAQINNAYAALPSNGGTIYAPCGVFNYATPIVFGTEYKTAILIGCGGAGFYASGGTTLVYTSSTGIGFTYNVQNFSSAGMGLKNISIVGPAGVGQIGSSTSASNTTSTVGVLLGGVNGATGFQMDGVQVSGWGKGVQLGDNIFLLNITNSVLNKNGMNLYSPTASGAVGENNRVTNSVLADGNSATGGSISDYCVYISMSGSIQWTFANNSIDDCQIYSSQYGGSGLPIKLTNNHFEDPNNTSGDGAYYYVAGLAGQNGTVGSSLWISTGNDYMQDWPSSGSNTPEPAIILNGATVVSQGDSVSLNNNVTAPMQAFIQNQDGNDVDSITGFTQEYNNTFAGATSSVVNVVASTTSPGMVDGFVIGTTTPLWNISSSSNQFGSLINVLGASSTVRVGVVSKFPGCLEMYDAAASGTLNYVYSSGTALVDTSSKPTFCQ